MKSLSAVTRLWSFMGRSVCRHRTETLAGLVTRSPPLSLPAPSGAHTQEAAGCGPALAAAHTSTLLAGQPPSLPPSSPLPAAASLTAPPGQPRARRARAREPGAAHLGAAAGPGPGSHRRSPAGTQLQQPASRARPLHASPSAQSEDERPGPGTQSPLNFVKT